MITGRDLKLFQQRTCEAQSLRAENAFLRGDRDHDRRECFFADQRIAELLERVERAEAENRRLVRQTLELKAAAESVGCDNGGRAPTPGAAADGER